MAAEFQPCWASPPCGGARSRTAWSVWARRAASSRSTGGRPCGAAGLARGDRTFHGVSRMDSRRPPRPLAAEHRVHDAGRVPGKGPAAFPDPDRPVPLEARHGPVRERRDAGRPGVQGPEPGRRQHLRRLHRRRPPRPLHDLVRRRPRRLAVRQPRRRHVRRPLGRGRPRRAGLCPERSPAPTTTTTASPTSCSSAGPGRSRPGCRCCGTRGVGSSRT